MALAAELPPAHIGSGDDASPRSLNDAFSFWKLPENLRCSVADSLDKSRIRAEHFLLERYVGFMEARRLQKSKLSRGKSDRLSSRLSSRIDIRSRANLIFPRWPCETALIEHWNRWLHESLEGLQLSDELHLAFWPRGATCSIVLTHDVRNSGDFAQIEAITKLEGEYGFRSAWYLPLEDVECNWRQIEALRARCVEFGIRGCWTRKELEIRRLKPRLEGTVRDHQLKGLRVTSACRDLGLIEDLNVNFDSSFCDTDPFESRPGGTCSIFPFFIGGRVELPLTIARDHTLIHLLRRNPLATWSLKTQWIANAGGMILLATEPRYVSIEPYLTVYKDLLNELARLDAWHALPSEVAAWWKRRDEAGLVTRQGQPRIVGTDVSELVVQKLSETPLFQ